ncbi:hypothetical protein [Amycolatopsis sp. GM8]|uniref:hypothetical protein n=1 Tax=Amycolatopsis sp. GM8 TaxID=2896530 RepID=UPI001F431A89|nr:hypothetical protein [Amycolatopsis sp. GM8]
MTDGGPFDFEAYLDRQRTESAGGPTMAEILDDMDRYRADGLPGDLIVESLRASRDERETQLDGA